MEEMETSLAPGPVAPPPRSPATPRPGLVPLLPRALRAGTRPPLWVEALIIGIGYWLYSLVRNGVPTHRSVSLRHAADVLAVEGSLHVRIEQSVNHWVAGLRWLALGADYWYASMHFLLTLGVLVWLWRSHPARYRTARSALVITNLFALLGFWLFPLAPPRMLAGYVDTVVRDHVWGSWASSGVDAASNQYAAMPSMHIGWSLWCGLVIVVLARRRWVRVLGALYPAVTLLVIIGTANHYVVDAVGGAAALAVACVLVRLLYGRPTIPALAPGSAVSSSGDRNRLISGTATSGFSSTGK
jgi:hypothetical protein